MKKITDFEKLNHAVLDFKEYLLLANISNSDRTKIENIVEKLANYSRKQEMLILQKESQDEFIKSQLQEARDQINELTTKSSTTTEKREQDLINLIKESRVFFNKIKYPYLVAKDGKDFSAWVQKSNEVLSNYDELALNYTPLKKVA